MTFHKTFPHELYCDHRNINCEVHDIVISQAWIFVNCRLANGLGTVIETLVTIWTNLLRVYTLQQQCSLVTQPYHGFYLTVNLVCYSLVNVFIQHNLTDIFHLWHCNSALKWLQWTLPGFFNSNSAGPDQMSHSVTSDLGLHCLAESTSTNGVMFVY